MRIMHNDITTLILKAGCSSKSAFAKLNVNTITIVVHLNVSCIIANIIASRFIIIGFASI